MKKTLVEGKGLIGVDIHLTFPEITVLSILARELQMPNNEQAITNAAHFLNKICGEQFCLGEIEHNLFNPLVEEEPMRRSHFDKHFDRK